MTTDLVVRSTDVPEAFDAQMRMAQVLADSSLLPGHLRGKPANVLLVLMGARTLNISAFQALQSIIIIDGKLAMDATMMRALMTRAGHTVRVIERTAKRAIVEVKRHDRETPYRAEFTYEDAVAAKLIKKENYEKYLKAMLVARATSIVWRDECADAAYGVSYTPEELGAKVTEDGTARVDNDGKVVLDGETVEPVSQEMVDAWHDLIFEAEMKALPAAWEHVLSRRAGDRVHTDGEWTLYQQMASRMVAEAQGALTVEEVRELWRLGVLMGVMDLLAPSGTVVGEALKAQPGRIQAAADRLRAEQDAAAETPPAPPEEVVVVDLDEIQPRPEYLADPETVKAALDTWDIEGEADTGDDPA